ncbi:hypothetical protein PINS_up003575 [Pythium insidiosum]|nr:hypothetical protein PINS_up003575 [Pythium insidiosum]
MLSPGSSAGASNAGAWPPALSAAAPPVDNAEERRRDAIALVLAPSPWTPLLVRRGSVADVSVKITLDDLDAEGEAKADDACVALEFVVEAFDVGFVVLENGRPMTDVLRVSAPTLDDARGTESPAATATYAHVIESVKRASIYTLRWDNSYSFVRHKQVQYRFAVLSHRAFATAELAATDLHHRRFRPPLHGASVKPQLSKRLALERRLTVDETTMEQTRIIEELQRCVTDMVSTFVMDPDRPLHEGSAREFVLAFETVLRNGIKERYVQAWPEEPYLEFLTHIQSVLRDDEGLIAEAMAVKLSSLLPYLGWTRARAIIFLALNKNILHRAFENLFKRRSIVEMFYEKHALVFMYTSASQIVSFLSALNAVKFSLAPHPDVIAHDVENGLPPNLLQCATDARPQDGVLISLKEDVPIQDHVTGFVYSNPSSDPDNVSRICDCSIPRWILRGSPQQEVSIGRSAIASISIPHIKGAIALALQISVQSQDILLMLTTRDDIQLIESIKLTATDEWTDIILPIEKDREGDCVLQLDNSFSLVRGKTVVLRFRVITLDDYDTAWEACQTAAQTISWKIAVRYGITRCEELMQQKREQERQELDVHRSRESSGANDENREDESIIGKGASLISKPVSYLVGGFLMAEDENAGCFLCMTPFSFFSRQHVCPSCHQVFCASCCRHYTQLHGKGPQQKVCDRCFIKAMDSERQRRREGQTGNASATECPEYAALRKDPQMEKYFKMLAFGVPHTGVAQKMLQDEMPSEKILVFSAGPTGNPVIPTASRRTSVDKDARLVRRGNSLRKVHWTTLEEKRAGESIWNRLTARRVSAPIRLSPQDFDELSSLFGERSVGRSPNAKGPAAKARVFSALDSRRSNNISIGLSQFKSIGGD